MRPLIRNMFARSTVDARIIEVDKRKPETSVIPGKYRLVRTSVRGNEERAMMVTSDWKRYEVTAPTDPLRIADERSEEMAVIVGELEARLTWAWGTNIRRVHDAFDTGDWDRLLAYKRLMSTETNSCMLIDFALYALRSMGHPETVDLITAAHLKSALETSRMIGQERMIEVAEETITFQMIGEFTALVIETPKSLDIIREVLRQRPEFMSAAQVEPLIPDFKMVSGLLHDGVL